MFEVKFIKKAYNKCGYAGDVSKVGCCNILAGNPLVSVGEIMFVNSEEDFVEFLHALRVDGETGKARSLRKLKNV
jgi:hypothetical protein